MTRHCRGARVPRAAVQSACTRACMRCASRHPPPPRIPLECPLGDLEICVMKCARIIAHAGHSPARGRMTTRAVTRCSHPPRLPGLLQSPRARDTSNFYGGAVGGTRVIHRSRCLIRTGRAFPARSRSTWLPISSVLLRPSRSVLLPSPATPSSPFLRRGAALFRGDRPRIIETHCP